MFEYNVENLRVAMAELEKQHDYFGNKLAELQGDSLAQFDLAREISKEEKIVEETFEKILAAEKALRDALEMFYTVQTHNEHAQAGITSIV